MASCLITAFLKQSIYVHVRLRSAMRNCDKMSVAKPHVIGPLVFGTCFAIMSADCGCSL